MIPSAVEQAVYGLVVTPAAHLADKHLLFAALAQSGPSTAAELAEQRGLDSDTTERLLLVLTAAGLLKRRDGRYALDPAVAPYLDPQSAHYLGGFITHMVEVAASQLARVEQCLLQGKDGAEAGLPAPYERFYQDENSTGEFVAAMWSLSYGVSRELAALADLADYKTLIDVGGANGPFAVAALQEYPGLTATVFDLPPVEPHLRQTARGHGLEDRLTFAGGDFFADDLPPGDVIALGYVMSNWPDPQCQQILDNAYRSCAPQGKVLVMDRLFSPDWSGPMATSVMNLTMQVETDGRHRTEAEFTQLLKAAGFVNTEVRLTSGDKHLIVARKPPAF